MRFTPAFLLVVVLATAVGTTACAGGKHKSSQDNWRQTVEALGSSEVQNDCTRMWRLLWPWARKGQAEAATALAELVRWRHLTPGGLGEDALARLRLSMGLFKAAAQAGSAEAMQVLVDFYEGGVFGQPASQPLLGCWQAALHDKNRLPACRLLESKHAIIPDLNVLAMEITPDSSAQCLAPEGDTVRRE